MPEIAISTNAGGWFHSNFNVDCSEYLCEHGRHVPTDVNNPDCVLEGILLEIVAGQNHQIQLMKKFLETRRYPMTDNCDVYVKTLAQDELLDGSEAVPIDLGNQSGSLGWTLSGSTLTLLVSLMYALGR